jgi:LAO/AO transport system kinase
VTEQKFEESGWNPPVIKTIATTEIGIAELIKTIFEHREYLQKSGLIVANDRERLQNDFEHLLRFTLLEKWKSTTDEQKVTEVMSEMFARKCSPGQAVDRLVNK